MDPTYRDNLLKSLGIDGDIENVNKALRLVKDNEGCNIFCIEELITFVYKSLSLFNEIPPFTNFKWSDTKFIDQFLDVLLRGITCLALDEKSNLCKGTPGDEVITWREEVKVIKGKAIF